MTIYGDIRTNRQRIQGTACSYPEAQAYQPRQDGDQRANLHNTFTFTLGPAAQLLRGSRSNVNCAGRALSEGTPAAVLSGRDVGEHFSFLAGGVLLAMTFAA